MKFRNIFINNFGLKILSLLLAFITFIYVGEAIKTDLDKTVLQKLFSRPGYISKKLYVKAIFVGELEKGYQLQKDAVKSYPESVMVIGPSKFIASKEYIFTEPIDLSEHTKTKTLDVELANISRSIKSQKTKAQIYLPIKKIDANATEE